MIWGSHDGDYEDCSETLVNFYQTTQYNPEDSNLHLEPLFEKWRIKINVNKCSTTLFSERLKHLRYDLSPLKILRTNIAWSNEVKYLGVILDRKLTYR
jgi:hypothetical protein